MRPSHILISSTLLCSPFVVAWPWSSDTVNQVRELIYPHLNKRAPQEVTLGSTNAATPEPNAVISTNTAISTLDDSSSTKDSSDKNGPSTLTSDGGSSTQTSGGDQSTTGSGDSSGTKTNSSDKSTGKSETTKTFDPRLPAGGLTMVTPNPTSQAAYFKIGNYLTFGWNFTSLSVTPSALDILASCATNQATYTIALNQSVSASTGAVTWDTGKYQKTATVALLTGTYTLIIYDADSSISATAAAGYLAPFDQFTFGMYTPQPYVALDGNPCVTCNGAGAIFEKQTMSFAMLMATITVISFTCFARGAGILL